MDFLEIISRQLGVGSEQPDIVSSVTCDDSSILAASAHQTLGRGLGIVDACCLRRCLHNPRISSSIRPLPQPLRLTKGKSFFIKLCCGSFRPDFQTAFVSRVFFSSFNRGFTNVMPSTLTLHLVLSPVEVTTTRRPATCHLQGAPERPERRADAQRS